MQCNHFNYKHAYRGEPSHFCLVHLATADRDEKHRLPPTVVAENWQIDRFRYGNTTIAITTTDNKGVGAGGGSFTITNQNHQNGLKFVSGDGESV